MGVAQQDTLAGLQMPRASPAQSPAGRGGAMLLSQPAPTSHTSCWCPSTHLSRHLLPALSLTEAAVGHDGLVRAEDRGTR